MKQRPALWLKLVKHETIRTPLWLMLMTVIWKHNDQGAGDLEAIADQVKPKAVRVAAHFELVSNKIIISINGTCNQFVVGELLISCLVVHSLLCVVVLSN